MVPLQTTFDRQFEARRKGGGETCQGEEFCAMAGTPHKKPGLRELKSPGNTRTAEQICAGCDLLPTKPGNVPAHLAHFVMVAHRMEALFESHAGSSYPVEFTPLEWEAFLALKYARAKDQEKDFQSKQKDRDKSAAQAALDARLGRG